MKVLIAGAGNVGTSIAEQLLHAGHDVTVIEQVAAVVRQAQRLSELEGCRWVVGDACELGTLANASADMVDVLASVTGDDEDNLVISLLAKQEFGVPRVVARVNNPKNEWMFNEMWGIDVSISTPHLITALVEDAVSVGTLVRLLAFEDGKIRLAEVTLGDSSPALDQKIVGLDLPRSCTVVAILRQGQVLVPRGDTVLSVGDEVIVLVTDESEDDVRRVLTGT
jgi:trk system potassium uptake protein TrkA